jgi:ribonuclease-3 family protein
MNTKKGKVNELNQWAVSYVNASSQGYVARKLEGFLNEYEWALLKRGRNQKSTPPKNANVSDYKYATGFEALLGYLYLSGENDRIFEIIKESIRLINDRDKNE